MPPTFLELLQHEVELGILEDGMKMMLIKLAESFQRNAVVGIHKCQILDVEKTDDVRSLPVIHRDSEMKDKIGFRFIESHSIYREEALE